LVAAARVVTETTEEASMRRLAFALVTSLALAAGRAAADGGPSPGIDFGQGIVGPHGKLRYVAVPSRNGTTVESIRTSDGRVQRWWILGGTYGVPYVTNDRKTGGLSRDGRTLVLASYANYPGRHAFTRFAVLNPQTLRPRLIVTLRGSFSYDALSPDGSTLYLIQYASVQNVNDYRVRAYDLRLRRLVPGAIVDRREPSDVMAGSPVTRTTSANGAWVYTLYARPSGPSFIHALDTVHRQAVCLDLRLRAITDVRLALTPDRKQILLLQRDGVRLASVPAPG
jgi:hypothetical protein